MIFPGSSWLWFAGPAAGLGLLLLAWSYLAAPTGLTRFVCFALKAAGLGAVALCLLEPIGSGQRARPGANVLAVVADNSQSLQLKDRGSQRTRGEELRELFDPQRGHWQAALEENFEVRRYTFDARLEASKDFGDLKFDGRTSALGSALRTLAERCRGRPLAGVLLLTDGNATDISAAPDLSGLPPIYPVVIGSPDAAKDLAVQQVSAAQSDFEDAPVAVQANVSAVGFHGASVVARLSDESGKEVAQQTLRAPNDDAQLAFRFSFRPERPGLSFYRVQVRPKGEPGPAQSEEATLVNNSSVVAVERGHGPYRILYVSGRPNWEFKFLNRAAQDDGQLQLVGLIRVAKREPKFTFMGRPGESSNPLFRGFGTQSAEEVERYDQPVLVRLNTRDEFELRGGFPRTAEELYGYHAVILGDLESGFFTPDQAALLQKYVSERGGGFLMLGGAESFREGNYQRTPIGDMLPVYLDPVEVSKPPVAWELTREGMLQAWARLRDTESEEKARLQTMVTFQVLNFVRGVKPGASVIATVTDTNHQSWPALVVQRFGRGHTAALLAGDVWRWGFHDSDAHRDMDKAWRQLLRWLVNDVPNRVGLEVQSQPDSPNAAVRLRARVRDARFEPLDDAALSLEVTPVMAEAGSGTNIIRLPMEPSAGEPGVYEATYVPRATGGYRATVCVTNSDGVEVGRAAAGWSSDLAGAEFRSLRPNVALLESLARRTGGEMVSAAELERFARNLPFRHAPVMEPWTYPLWHTPAVFGFALACFLAEWGLRRWRGMP